MSQIENIEQYKLDGVFREAGWDDGKPREVYSIPLSLLFYNKDNGRISSFISEYEADPKNPVLNDLDIEPFNLAVQKMIIDSEDEETHSNLLKSIGTIGQMQVGLITDDGRVMGGNRRFTALREMYQKTNDEKFAYFKCFVLPVPTSDKARAELKRIELKDQNDVPERVDYSPSEKLIEAYKVVVKSESMKECEYVQHIGAGKSDKNIVTRARIMDEFLRCIKRPECFYLVRNHSLASSFQALETLYLKIESTHSLSLQHSKRVLYALIAYTINNKELVEGNVNHLIKNTSSFFMENEDEANEAYEIVNDYWMSATSEEKDTLTINSETFNKVVALREKAVKNKIKGAWKKHLSDAEDSLSEFSLKIVSRMNDDDIDTLNEYIEKIEENLNNIRKEIKKRQ